MIPSLLFAAAFVSTWDPGIDTRLASGLAVTIDRIGDPVTVDGVRMIVQRATGAGVPALARRVEESWRHQGSEIQIKQLGNWTIRSRLHGPRSEVMQWRINNTAPELILSILDVMAPLQTSPSADLVLPAGCAWGRSIFGHGGNKSYVQKSARCTQSMRTLSVQLRKAVVAQGWNVVLVTDSGLRVDRPGNEGFISLSSQQGDPATWLTWLRLESSQ